MLADAHDAAGEAVTSPSEVPPESVGAHLRAVADRLDARVSTTMAAFDAASGAERAAAEALAAARALDDLRTRGIRALAQLDELAAGAPRHEERALALADAERAAPLAGHLAAHGRAEADEASARAVVEHHRQSVVRAHSPRPPTARWTTPCASSTTSTRRWPSSSGTPRRPLRALSVGTASCHD